jgi:hypothetical protein
LFLPARLPEDLVAAEEGEVDARVARALTLRALLAGPVLVVPEDMKILWLRISPP